MLEAQTDPRKENTFLNLAEIAFDVQSGGMGIHARSVELFLNEKVLPDWALASLVTSGGNFHTHPYVNKWINPDTKISGLIPRYMTPNSERHKALILETHKRYNSLHSWHDRFALGGEDGIEQCDDSWNEIEFKEYKRYLTLARNQSIIDFPDEIDFSALDRRNNISSCMFEIKRKYSLEVDIDKYGEAYRRAQTDSRVQDVTRYASLLKLGSMLAVTDQLTYDAYHQGMPLPADFRSDKWRETWMQKLGSSMPRFGDLVDNAQVTFERFADRNEPYYSHIFGLPIHRQLA